MRWGPLAIVALVLAAAVPGDAVHAEPGSWRRTAKKLGATLQQELGLAQTATELQDAVETLEREGVGIEYDAAILDHAGRESMRRLDAYRGTRDGREDVARKRARALVKLARGGALRIAFEDAGGAAADRIARGRDLRWLVRHDLQELSVYRRAEARAEAELLSASRELQALSALATVRTMQTRALEDAREAIRPELRRAKAVRKRLTGDEEIDDRAIAAQRDLIAQVKQSWRELAKLKGLGRRGRVMRPVEGRVVGTFGEYEDPVLRLPMIRNGIELRAKSDEAVHVLDDGRVALISRLPGFEEVVVVDHGGGELSMTGRLWELQVAVGDELQRGDVLGRAAPKAIDDGLGTTVYLEVRHGDRPVDPEPLLSRAVTPSE